MIRAQQSTKSKLEHLDQDVLRRARNIKKCSLRRQRPLWSEEEFPSSVWSWIVVGEQDMNHNITILNKAVWETEGEMAMCLYMLRQNMRCSMQWALFVDFVSLAEWTSKYVGYLASKLLCASCCQICTSIHQRRQFLKAVLSLLQTIPHTAIGVSTLRAVGTWKIMSVKGIWPYSRDLATIWCLYVHWPLHQIDFSVASLIHLHFELRQNNRYCSDSWIMDDQLIWQSA